MQSLLMLRHVVCIFTTELWKFYVFRRNEFLSIFNEYTVKTKELDLYKLGIFKVGFKMYRSCVPLKPHAVLLLLCEKPNIGSEIMQNTSHYWL